MKKSLFKSKFLLVQGRALNQNDESLQSFPSNWMEEFPLIEKLGFNGIEWIYDEKSEYNNPILNLQEHQNMKMISKKYNVSLENIVFDWFITHPILKKDDISLSTKIQKLIDLIDYSEKIGFQRVIFPLLEGNAIHNSNEMELFLKIFSDDILSTLNLKKLEIHFETSMSPNDEFNFISRLDNSQTKICFDMGNSASLGFDCSQVLNKIYPFLGSVHIKDRLINGGTVPLGDGSVDFLTVFMILNKIKFSGPISFQAYRDKNSNNVELLKSYLMFINNIIARL
jgi:L-ribulose-5-phosphate 3-epimerase